MSKHNSIKTPQALLDEGLITPNMVSDVKRVAQQYAIAITPEMASLIDKQDPLDPIGLQFIPSLNELDHKQHELSDPIGDEVHSPVTGIVHRYPDRVLFKAVHVCPVYCRFCFRREMVGPQGKGTMTQDEIDTALSYLREHKEIWEVIFTGGDPLIMSPRRLETLMKAMSDIEHVKIVRFHTRVPVVSPSHINDELINALKASGKTVYVALHANHAKELTPQARMACSMLIDAGISMVSQTVLLRGINNDANILADLMKAFVETRIKPYYLHHADLAPGTSHFRVSIDEGREIVKALRGQISGLCQPTYVLDIPGGYGKAPIAESATSPNTSGLYEVLDYKGTKHPYQDVF